MLDWSFIFFFNEVSVWVCMGDWGRILWDGGRFSNLYKSI